MTLYRVTQDIYVGRFASPDRIDELRELRVTDVLNVSDTPSQLTPDFGPFRAVNWVEIEDRKRVPTHTALDAIDFIHQSLVEQGGRVYIHCMAGWNRSPTIVWLYLIACGFASTEAAKNICANAFDAVPGHPLLVDSDLITTVQTHGRARYLPHPRPAALAVP